MEKDAKVTQKDKRVFNCQSIMRQKIYYSVKATIVHDKEGKVRLKHNCTEEQIEHLREAQIRPQLKECKILLETRMITLHPLAKAKICGNEHNQTN